jgi:hypothetical protein
MHQVWRLSEYCEGNLGVCFTDDGLFLGRTPLIERQGAKFAVRGRTEIERLLSRAYGSDLAVDRLLPGLATVTAALNANDPGLARIAAVHLRIPDLPDRIAREGMEAEDALIRLARGDATKWNPAQHPRTGTPPNPGWFAPTGGSTDESSSEQSTPGIDDPVALPPGQRNDELGDLLQWIANAKPGDEQAIRSEISRRYSDVGDTLNSALDTVLEMGGGFQARQKVLDGIEPLSRIDPDADPSTDLLIGAGLLLLGMIPPGAAVETVSAAWELGWAARGLYFSEQLGADLPATFRTIDSFSDGVATSIKSIDLNAATYQDVARLTYRLNDYIDKLALYEGSKMGDITISSSEISGRALSLAVPKGSMTAAQRAAIEAARVRAQAFGVDLTITTF